MQFHKPSPSNPQSIPFTFKIITSRPKKHPLGVPHNTNPSFNFTPTTWKPHFNVSININNKENISLNSSNNFPKEPKYKRNKISLQSPLPSIIMSEIYMSIASNKHYPSEYFIDNYNDLLLSSTFQDYSFTSIQNIQSVITPSMRSTLINWIVGLHSYFSYNEDTLFLTVNIIDRFISTKSLPKDKFQLLGVSSFLIASKYHEIMPASTEILHELTDKYYSEDDIISFENEILKVLNFNVSLPTCFDLYQFMSVILNYNKKDFYLGMYLLEAFLVDFNSTKYKPMIISEAACYLVQAIKKALNENKGEIDWIKLGNNIEIKQCAIEMYINSRDIIKTEYKIVVEKFLKEKFMRISEIYGKDNINALL